MSKFAITTADVRKIERAIGQYASKDTAFPAINRIELRVEGEHVYASTTDRYRLAVVRVPLANDTGEYVPHGRVTLSLADLERISKSVDVKAYAAPVRFERYDEDSEPRATATDVYGGAEWALAGQDINMPPLGELISGALADCRSVADGTAGTPAASFAANPAYIADLKRTATALKERGEPAVFHPGSQRTKPFLVTIGQDFLLLQMPVRVEPARTAETLAEWAGAF